MTRLALPVYWNGLPIVPIFVSELVTMISTVRPALTLCSWAKPPVIGFSRDDRIVTLVSFENVVVVNIAVKNEKPEGSTVTFAICV